MQDSPNFYSPKVSGGKFAKVFLHQTFALYGIYRLTLYILFCYINLGHYLKRHLLFAVVSGNATFGNEVTFVYYNQMIDKIFHFKKGEQGSKVKSVQTSQRSKSMEDGAQSSQNKGISEKLILWYLLSLYPDCIWFIMVDQIAIRLGIAYALELIFAYLFVL